MIGLYTAMFGDYDAPLPTPYRGILFTDQNIMIKGWDTKIVSMPYANGRNSRYYFVNSCSVMPEYDITIMHGANAILKMSPDVLVDMLPDGVDLACCAHHHRHSVYDEAKSVIRFGKDKKQTVRQQMERYKAEGFNGKDLSATIILIRRNTPAMKEFEALWWEEVNNNSHRDQLSFDYCRWRLNFPIFRLPGTWNDYIKLRKHRNGKNYNDQKD